MNKAEEYKELVRAVHEFDAQEIGLRQCEECKEINLWNYWEGGEKHLDADVLLVGQDWGSLNIKGENVLEKIKDGQTTDFCYMEDNKNATNRNICRLMKSFVFPDIDLFHDTNKKRNLFFTNFVPWYRLDGEKSNGDFQDVWAKNSAPFFAELVKIIEPKYILCLGRTVYDSVCDSLEIESPYKKSTKYKEIVEKGPLTLKNKFGKSNVVVPLYHPGNLRHLYCTKEEEEKSWKKLGEYINDKTRNN